MNRDIEPRITSKVREKFIPNPKLKLLDHVSEVMPFKHYSIRTESTYREWIKRFILFHGKRHPKEMGAFEVERFLSDLAVRRKVAAVKVRNPSPFNPSPRSFAGRGKIFLLPLTQGGVVPPYPGLISVTPLGFCVWLAALGWKLTVCSARLFEEMEGTARVMAELMHGRPVAIDGVAAVAGQGCGPFQAYAFCMRKSKIRKFHETLCQQTL